MELLQPDWNQKRPNSNQARAMCALVPLQLRQLTDIRLDIVLESIRHTHQNGGALFASFDVGPNETFDWFASRNRLLEFGILRLLLDRAEVSGALPELKIPPSRLEDPVFSTRKLQDLMSSGQLAEMMKLDLIGGELERHGIDQNFDVAGTESDDNFRVASSFTFDGELAQAMYAGGAYARPTGDGKAEREKSLAFVDALFDLRFSDIWYCSTHSPWTPWFGNIAWDWTAILFDQRTRALTIIAITDSD